MAITKEEKEIRKIERQTIKDMESLNVYREEFAATIRAYSEQRYLLDILNQKFAENGYKATEAYTNKAGATNVRKTAEYMILETLRRDILNYEQVLGLTPSGLKKIRADTKTKRASKLGNVLNGL